MTNAPELPSIGAEAWDLMLLPQSLEDENSLVANLRREQRTGGPADEKKFTVAARTVDVHGSAYLAAHPECQEITLVTAQSFLGPPHYLPARAVAGALLACGRHLRWGSRPSQSLVETYVGSSNPKDRFTAVHGPLPAPQTILDQPQQTRLKRLIGESEQQGPTAQVGYITLGIGSMTIGHANPFTGEGSYAELNLELIRKFMPDLPPLPRFHHSGGGL